MAALPGAVITASVLAGFGAWYMNSNLGSTKTGIPDAYGSDIVLGATVKLTKEAAVINEKTCLASQDYGKMGTVVKIDRVNKKVNVRCRGNKNVLVEEYLGTDLEVVYSTLGSRGIAILGGIAVPGSVVKLQNTFKKANADKALGNPFYEDKGKVTRVLIEGSDREILVKVKRLDQKQDREEYYNADHLELISGPMDSKMDISGDKRSIVVGSRVKLQERAFYKNAGKYLALKDTFEKIGKVTAIRLSPTDATKYEVTVSTSKIDKSFIGEDMYDRDDLEYVPKEKRPLVGIAIFGGMAAEDVKVKIRDERREHVKSKPLGRSTFGDVGTVDKLDPESADNLKIYVRCNGVNADEQTGDWYEPEDLEIAEPEDTEGLPIFGGRATVGTFVAATEESKGKKCLGKTQYGDVGVVKGVDPNASEGLTINVVCGMDKNGKQSEWYAPTELRLYVPPEEGGDANLADAKNTLNRLNEELAGVDFKISVISKKLKEISDSASKVPLAQEEVNKIEAKLLENPTSREKRALQNQLKDAKLWLNGAKKAEEFFKQKPIKLEEDKAKLEVEKKEIELKIQEAEEKVRIAKKSSKNAQRIEEAYVSTKRNLELARIRREHVYAIYTEASRGVSCDGKKIDIAKAYRDFTTNYFNTWRDKLDKNNISAPNIGENKLKQIQHSDEFKKQIRKLKIFIGELKAVDEETRKRYIDKLTAEINLEVAVSTKDDENFFDTREERSLEPDDLDNKVRRVADTRASFDSLKSDSKTKLDKIDELLYELRDIARNIEVAAFLGDTTTEQTLGIIQKRVTDLENQQKELQTSLSKASIAYRKAFLIENGSKTALDSAKAKYNTLLVNKGRQQVPTEQVIREVPEIFPKEKEFTPPIRKPEPLEGILPVGGPEVMTGGKAKGNKGNNPGDPSSETTSDNLTEALKNIEKYYTAYAESRIETLKLERDEKIISGKMSCLLQLIETGKDLEKTFKENVKTRCDLLTKAYKAVEKLERSIRAREAAFVAAQIAKDPCRGRASADVNNPDPTERNKLLDDILTKVKGSKDDKELLANLEELRTKCTLLPEDDRFKRVNELDQLINQLKNPAITGGVYSEKNKIMDKFLNDQYPSKQAELGPVVDHIRDIETAARSQEEEDRRQAERDEIEANYPKPEITPSNPKEKKLRDQRNKEFEQYSRNEDEYEKFLDLDKVNDTSYSEVQRDIDRRANDEIKRQLSSIPSVPTRALPKTIPISPSFTGWDDELKDVDKLITLIKEDPSIGFPQGDPKDPASRITNDLVSKICDKYENCTADTLIKFLEGLRAKGYTIDCEEAVQEKIAEEKKETIALKPSENVTKGIELAEKVVNEQKTILMCKDAGSDIILASVLKRTSEADSYMFDLNILMKEIEQEKAEIDKEDRESQRKVQLYEKKFKDMNLCFKTEKERAEKIFNSEETKIKKALDEVKDKLYELKQQNNQNNRYDDKPLEELYKEYKETFDKKDGLASKDDKNKVAEKSKQSEFDRLKNQLGQIKGAIARKGGIPPDDKGNKPVTPATGGNRRVTRRRPRY